MVDTPARRRASVRTSMGRIPPPPPWRRALSDDALCPNDSASAGCKQGWRAPAVGICVRRRLRGWLARPAAIAAHYRRELVSVTSRSVAPGPALWLEPWLVPRQPVARSGPSGLPLRAVAHVPGRERETLLVVDVRQNLLRNGPRVCAEHVGARGDRDQLVVRAVEDEDASTEPLGDPRALPEGLCCPARRGIQLKDDDQLAHLPGG